MTPAPPPEPGIPVDTTLVRRLLAAQLPHWAALPIRAVPASGRDTVVFRLGDALAVRLPRRDLGARHLLTEARWLPALAPSLPLPVPAPIAVGQPGAGYPWSWTVTPWFSGATAADRPVRNPLATADLLAGFVTALHAVDPTGGPPADLRGGPLVDHDTAVRAMIGASSHRWDPARITAVWAAAVAAPAWTGPGVWTHGDLHPANLLVTDGRLSAVLDFGLCGVGDPAADLLVGWALLDAPARRHLFATLRIDEPTSIRARGRALAFGLMCATHTPPDSVADRIGRRTVDAVLADLVRND
ncbi:MAG TPA: aminoglycoside phosphotransferase family protein [Micromonospora sp.]